MATQFYKSSDGRIFVPGGNRNYIITDPQTLSQYGVDINNLPSLPSSLAGLGAENKSFDAIKQMGFIEGLYTPEEQQTQSTRINQLKSTINTTDPGFLKDYGGQQMVWGDDVFNIGPTGEITYGSGFQSAIKQMGNSAFNLAQFDGSSINNPLATDWNQQKAFQYINPTTSGYQAAASNNFGMGPAAPTADQYTGKLGGFTQGGVQLYEIKDASGKIMMTATPPPSGAMTGQGVATGYEDSQNQARNQQSSTDPATQQQNPEMQAAAVQNVPSGYQLKNPGIATANPGASANENFINALYQEAYGRDATARELDIYTGRTVADASNIILGQSRSPFATGSTAVLTDVQREGTEMLPGSEEAGVSDAYSGLLGQYGVKPYETGENPTTTFAETYKQLLTEMGLPDLKSQIENANLQFSELQNQLNDEIQDVNDNPWLTEGVRLRRIQSLENRYEGKLGILTNQIKLFNSLYEQGMEEARFIAGAAFDQYQFDVNTQIKLAQLAQDQAEAEAELAKMDTAFTTGAGGERLLVNTQTGEVIANLGQSTRPPIRKGTPPTEPEQGITFEEFIQQKQNELGMSIAFPENYRAEYNEIIKNINSQLGGGIVEGRQEGFNYLNDIFKANPEATYEEMYILARSSTPDLSIADIENWLRSKGISKSTQTTTPSGGMTDEEFLKLLQQG